MSEEPIDPAQQKRILKGIGIGVGAVVVIIALVVGLATVFGSSGTEAKPELSEDQVAAASARAEEFITAAGTFGLSTSSSETKAFSYSQELVNANKGAYLNTDFGISRAETYEDNIIPLLDPRGELDVTQYFAETLDTYTPDWSGQLAQYGIKNVLITPGEAYEDKGRTLLPLQISFTSTLNLYKTESSFGGADSPWNHYTGEYFETVNLVLSQAGDDWLIWSIDDLEDYPYLLSTWSAPNWRSFSPNVNILEKVS